jgi:hypothetical protein
LCLPFPFFAFVCLGWWHVVPGWRQVESAAARPVN